MNAYMAHSDYGFYDTQTPICFGVNFDSSSNGNYIYQLRYNTTINQAGATVNDLGDIPDTKNTRIDPFARGNVDTITRYFGSGVLRVQTWIDNIILQKETGAGAKIAAQVIPQKVPAHSTYDLPRNLVQTVGTTIVFPLLIPFCLS